MKIISKSLEETQKFAHDFLVEFNAGTKSHLATQKTTSHHLQLVATVLLLQGDLGSGKTTFTQVLARELGVKENLTSPTFVLMKSYKISPMATERLSLSVKNLVHIDAYRLTSGADLRNLGWGELIKNPDNLIIVEWPELVADLWDGSELKINFKFVDDQTREMSYT
ncbi:MAG: tRNA (adenosine(37)-N6)-threonylcarbamoyltransferase complex ATPase subunit type 1 TsaE [Candidatus Paceibacterota bacterium]|jgi:tRNA threonylcarbamoyladenosine biosynthesis protein TsaE